MKKFLLFAAAALIAASANAQLVKKQDAGKPKAQQITQKASFTKKFEVAGAKAGVKAVQDKLDRKANKTISVTAINPVNDQFKATRRAAEVQPAYEGFGTSRSSGENETWTMEATTAQTQDGTTVNVMNNVIPNPFGFESILAKYSVANSSIVVEPTLVASMQGNDGNTYYLFLESATSADGKITFPLDDTGNITGSYSIIYSIYPNSVYNVNEWMQTYDGYTGVKYNLPGQDVAPEVSFETNNLIVFAGLGLNGYSFNNNLAMTGAYATTNFFNLTSDKTTAWDWKAYDATTEEETVYASGTDFDFSMNMEDGVVYNVTATATNNTKTSDPFTFGIGKYLNDDGTPRYETCYIYGGSTESSFYLNNETPAIMTRQDPDGDLTFYTNWATPDKASNPMSKIYCYHEKPASPLYIEGVTLPMVGFSLTDPDNNPFELHIKICKISWPKGRNSKPQLEEVLAEADATTESINDQFNIGLTAVEFTELYKESEDGLSEDIPYLFLDDEFMIVIEGWDNGSFSGVLGSQDKPLDNARTSTWFEMQGEEGSMYSYTSWKTSLFVGLLGATYGYLNTADDTNITLPAEGGEASVNVEAMLRSVNESGAYDVRLFIEDVVTASELDPETGLPAWLQIGIGNISESATEFTLAFQAEALPAGVDGRQATIVFMQEGARLIVTVTQGNATGISVTTKTVKNVETPAFNLAGQRVNKNFKGLVVKDGRKFMNK